MIRIGKKVIAGLICTSLLLVSAIFGTSASRFIEEVEPIVIAGKLQALSLFQGVSNDDFALDQGASRVEAAIMLVRLAGMEGAVRNGTCAAPTAPFEDVPDWAGLYVDCAYAGGLVRGVSDREFGLAEISCNQYLTMLLRLLGYEDPTDFDSQSPSELAALLGLLVPEVDRDAFLRNDLVLITWNALFVELKNHELTLGQQLVSQGVITQAQYDQLSLVTSEPGLSLSLEAEAFPAGTDQVSYSVINHTAETVSTIQSFTLEKQKGEAWEDIPLRLAFTDEMIILAPGERYEFTAWLLWGDEPLETGSYRIIKTVYVNEERLTLSAEFTLS